MHACYALKGFLRPCEHFKRCIGNKRTIELCSGNDTKDTFCCSLTAYEISYLNLRILLRIRPQNSAGVSDLTAKITHCFATLADRLSSILSQEYVTLNE